MSECSYVLPIRRAKFSESESAELGEYLSVLAEAGCEVLLVDGSPPDVFARHHRFWSDHCRHEIVDPRFRYLNDKVNGIHTGVALATGDKIILADDDIRYDKIDINKMCARLDDFEVVRPQNYFTIDRAALPSPGADASSSPSGRGSGKAAGEGNTVAPQLHWWAKMEAARMLINRATLHNADYPGTCAFRRETFVRAGEYDGDVLFDNEELIRHFARAGARICYANDFFISKRPPGFRKWLEQRPRQAYEDFGLRFKTALFASLLPIAIAIAFIDARWLWVFLLSILLAFAGWLRGDARKYFPPHLCLFAPLWLLERTLSTYAAFYWWLTRGGYPFGGRVLKKGIGRDWVEGGKVAAATPRK